MKIPILEKGYGETLQIVTRKFVDGTQRHLLVDYKHLFGLMILYHPLMEMVTPLSMEENNLMRMKYRQINATEQNTAVSLRPL